MSATYSFPGKVSGWLQIVTAGFGLFGDFR